MGFSVGAHLLPGFCAGIACRLAGTDLVGRQIGENAKAAATSRPTSYINNVPGIIAYTLAIMLPVYQPKRGDQELAWRIGCGGRRMDGTYQTCGPRRSAGAIRQFIPKPATMTVFGAAMYSYLALVSIAADLRPAAGGKSFALTIVSASVSGQLCP